MLDIPWLPSLEIKLACLVTQAKVTGSIEEMKKIRVQV